MSNLAYDQFIDNKSHLKYSMGFKPYWIPDFLFDFQKALVEWSIETGRNALFEDCGLGKTPQFLVWAENVVRHTNKPVLIVTPLSVSYQVVREGEKFGIGVEQSRDGNFSGKIIVTNYEKLHLFESSQFTGMVCDESSILKNFDGEIKNQIIQFIKKLPYRLLTTATASPNDFFELGNHSEALGAMGYMTMMNRFFKNDQNNSKVTGMHYGKKVQWRFRKHGEVHFWRFIASWARACRKPSDLGFDDSMFILPKLIEQQHIVDATRPHDGEMFARPAIGWREQKQELRDTIQARCEKVAELVNHGRPFVCWCNENNEGDLLEKLIPTAVQVAGKHSDEQKEERFKAFQDGEVLGMITKPKIGGFGLNWQHCAHTTFFPSHSFEQWYQCIRRLYRFGQKNDVVADVITTPGLDGILKNLQRKATQADRMFESLVMVMNDAMSIDTKYKFSKKEDFPTWL